eukprot:SAG31_NODE_47867_length_211_cov_12.705357_1_plen_34_part_10
MIDPVVVGAAAEAGLLGVAAAELVERAAAVARRA